MGGAAGNENRHSKLGDSQMHGGEIAGTPPYMSPEQWQGRKQDITTDVYAFGVVMYEMCYGRWPFTGSDVRELRAQHLDRQPNIPAGMFAQIIARCLAKDYAARYPDTVVLLADLARVCKEHGVPLPPKPVIGSQKGRELSALAKGLSAIGKPKEALHAVRQLVEIEPEVAGHWIEMGRLQFELGDDNAAIAAMERSLALDETRSPAWNNFGLALTRAKKWQEALFAFDRALDCDPFNTAPMLNSSRPLLHLGQGGKALLRLKRAAEIAPDKFQIWVNLGAVYVDLGDKKNALDCLKKARALAPDRHHDDIAKSIRVAQALPDEPSALALMHSDPAQARSRLEAQTLRNPRDKNAWHNLGLLQLQANDQAGARECFARVLDIDPKDSFAICRLIETSSLLKDIEAVERWCTVLKGMPGGHMPAIAFFARALVHCDQYDRARVFIRDMLRTFPNEPDLLIGYGDVLMNRPDSSSTMSDAAAAYTRAVEILNKGIDVARTREIEGRLKQAKHYLKLVKPKPDLA